MSLQHHPRIANLTYISIFSGIEAASVAWGPLGFQPLAFAEVDPFPSAVLEARFPHVPNLGDVTKADWSEFHGKTDIVVGGSPCQAFSIAGKRGGLEDERGKLMLAEHLIDVLVHAAALAESGLIAAPCELLCHASRWLPLVCPNCFIGASGGHVELRMLGIVVTLEPKAETAHASKKLDDFDGAR